MTLFVEEQTIALVLLENMFSKIGPMMSILRNPCMLKCIGPRVWMTTTAILVSETAINDWESVSTGHRAKIYFGSKKKKNNVSFLFQSNHYYYLNEEHV